MTHLPGSQFPFRPAATVLRSVGPSDLHAAAVKANELVGASYTSAREAQDAVAAARQKLNHFNSRVGNHWQSCTPSEVEAAALGRLGRRRPPAPSTSHRHRLRGAACGRQPVPTPTSTRTYLNSSPASEDDAEQAAQDVADAFESIAAIRARRGARTDPESTHSSLQHGQARVMATTPFRLTSRTTGVSPQDETEAPLPSDGAVAYYYPEASAAGVAG